jgi:hypothetical protein
MGNANQSDNQKKLKEPGRTQNRVGTLYMGREDGAAGPLAAWITWDI